MTLLRIALLSLALCFGSNAWSKGGIGSSGGSGSSGLGSSGDVPDVVWSTPAMACIPTATTAAEAKYVTTAGRIKFKDGHSGTLSFLCPVTVPLPNGTYVLAARANPPSADQTGLGFALRQADLDSGVVSTPIETDTIEASTQSASAFRLIVNAVPGSVSFHTGNNIYWVQITHKRPGVSILAVYLVRVPDALPAAN